MQKKYRIPSILKWLITFFLVSVLIMGIRYFCVQSYAISTHSMEQGLKPGDYVLVNKLPVEGNPGRNRTILFESPLLKDSLHPPVFVSRCIGMPGDTIEVSHEGYLINHIRIPFSPHTLLTYSISKDRFSDLEKMLRKLSVPVRNKVEDTSEVSLSLTPFEVFQIREELPMKENEGLNIKDFVAYKLIVPQKGRSYRLDANVLPACREALLRETNGEAIFRNHMLFIDGRETSFFHFSQDYYWVLSDNPEEAIDSRYLGFIPADRMIGNVWFCWLSKDPDRMFKFIH